jgi:predicted ribosome quality control (RQC) complex YloA/Tae2 family protein
MDYKYLAQFARETILPGLFYRTVRRWRDQYALVFNSDRFLQISLNQQSPYCFFSQREEIEWTESPELAMMEQHLRRAKLEKLWISDTDRIINLDFSKPHPLLQQQEFRLILELIPQFGNIILTRREGEKLIIIDCAKKITLSENPYRQILPAVEYEAPPAGFTNYAAKVEFPLGFDDSLSVIENCKNGFGTTNDLLEALYYKGFLKKLSDSNLKAHAKTLEREINKKIAKLEKLNLELGDAQKENEWLQRGELLKSSRQKIIPGALEIKLINYFLPEMPEITIKLQADKSLQENINYYYKKYRKAKTGRIIIKEQIEKTKREITELENDLAKLSEIPLLLPGQKIQAVSGKNPVAESLTRIKIDENWEFLIGRNSSENDLISTRLAKPDDWWFHTRIYRGTHIVLRNLKRQNLPENLLNLGCRLAAYFSKAGKSSNVPVDYTQIRYVRKPRGAAPGYVTYTNQKTLYVDPLSLRAAREEIGKWSNKQN